MKKRLLSLLLAFALLPALSGLASANNTKLLALTFDDGPNAAYSPELLDGLSARGVKATFFLVGRCVSANPGIAAREAAEGHQIANHTWSHAWLTKLSAAQVRKEIEVNAAALTAATGSGGPFYLRAPYGAVNSTVRASAGAPIILWSVDPGNGSMKASEESMDRTLLRTAFDGAIIILHDSSQKNINVAFYGIDQLRAQGYEFVTVSELFRLRGVTPQDGKVYYSVPSSQAEQSFDESQLSSHWAYTSIEAVIKAGILKGTGSVFLPNAWLSRAQAAVMLWRMAGSPAVSEEAPGSSAASETAGSAPSEGTTSPSPSAPPAAASAFADVPANAWYAQAVRWAHKNGYLLGNAGNFYPEQYITKEHLYTMLARYAYTELYAKERVASPAVYRDDACISSWAGESVALFRNAGFVSKNDPQIFRPKDYASRAEAAELVAWMLANIQK